MLSATRKPSGSSPSTSSTAPSLTLIQGGAGDIVCTGCGFTTDDRIILDMHFTVAPECARAAGRIP